ncbi:MAG: DoxX family protein [Bacteroidales bacterium]|jgi:putative oxidoreductase|nr:DoxX family protein [Bacteroidales bacterium]
MKTSDLAKLMLRLAVGGLMLFHGVHKLLDGFAGIKAMLAASSLPDWLWFGVIVGELLAPVLLLLGVWTKIASLFVMGTMFFSMYIAFGMGSFELTKTGGLVAELNLLYLFAAFAILLFGHGKYALQKKDTGLFS